MERKEAIEVIKKNWPGSSFTMLREALETVIPELKESEDEKIRKELYENIRISNPREVADKYIAWLKRQDEQMQALKDALNDSIMQYDFKGSPIKEEVTRKHAETIESLYND